MAQQPSYNYQPPPDPERQTVGWWGIGSVAAAGIAFAFLPASLFSSQWGLQIQQASPIWAILCCIGLATGLRGLQKQREATQRQRMIAAAGTLASLGVFIIFTFIAIFGAGNT